MEAIELRNMRIKQLVATNILGISAFAIYLIALSIFEITFMQFYLALGLLLFIQGVYGLLKGNSTKSIFPIFEKVAIYEKQKMGKEWYKQRKAGYTGNIVISILFFSLAFLNRNSTTENFQVDYLFMTIILVIALVLLNISLAIHMAKVDRSTSAMEFKGYTWKSYLIGIVIGLIIAMVIIVFTFYYIISSIV